jgi:cytochrome c peroxidase
MGWSRNTLSWRRTSLGLAACAAVVLGGTALASEEAERSEQPDPREDAKVELGRRLFFDPAASAFGKTSCASCHDPAHGFSDPQILSRDETGLTPRHSQGLLDLAEASGGFHWDGEFGTLQELVTSRLGTPSEIARDATRRLADHVESTTAAGAELDTERLSRELPRAMTASGPYGGRTGPAVTPSSVPAAVGAVTPGRSAAGTVVRRLAKDALYDEGFRRAYGDKQIDTERIADAIAAYVLSLESTESPFDRYMDGDSGAISASAERGFELFAGKAGCATCHTVPVPGRARAFSDFAFHNTGVAFLDDAAPKKERARKKGKGTSRRPPGARREQAEEHDAGRNRVSIRTDDVGRFKTPSLRDVAERAPYMHSGAFATLEDVVRYYDRGGTPNEHLDPAIRELGLTDGEVSDLVAFLESLSGDERPGVGQLPEKRVESVRIRLKNLEGEPLRRFRLTVRPVGDHFAGADALPEPFQVTTDRHGYAEFPFPASTHVALDARRHELGEGRLLPDWVEQAALIATPHDTVSVVVRKGGALKRLPSELFVTPIDGTPQKQPGRTATFRRERTLSGDRVLYTAPLQDVDHFGDCRTARLGVTVGGSLGEFDFDATGGATEEIDLRDVRSRDDRRAERDRLEDVARILELMTSAGIDPREALTAGFGLKTRHR